MDERSDEMFSRILEGMFKGLTARIKESQAALEKEFSYGVSQQGFSHEALLAAIDGGVEKLLTEIKYLAQQNLDIYDYMRKEHAKMEEVLLKEMEARTDALVRALDERLDAVCEKLLTAADAKLDERVGSIDAKFDEKLSAIDAKLDEKFAAIETKLDEKLGWIDSKLDEELAAIESAEPAEIDYDLFAEKVADLVKQPEDAPEEPAEEPVGEVAAEETAAADGTETEETAEEVPAEHAEADGQYFDDSNFAYDVLAEKIVTIMPEPDYDLIVDKLVAALPHVDSESVAEQVTALIHYDPEALAGDIAEHLPFTDYDLIAEKVTAVLAEHDFTPDDEFADKVARRVVELLAADERDLDRIAEEAAVTPLEELAAAAEPAPEEEPAPAEKPMPAPAPAPAAVVLPTVEDESKTIRYKRSFVAKLIESEEDVKGYYSDLKNAILSYGKVRSQINWTNDRFFIGNDSIIKIGMRGKTLVMYLALDPNEFPETVYHQKFAGDTKMYEMTPMMVKIKTKAAVKKATRLIDLCMEKFGAVKEDREPVDYAAEYFFRTEEELLAEGLIKTAIVDKSDLDF